MVLGHGLWQQRFGGNAAVVGRSIMLNGVPFAVVGVLPKGAVFPHNEPQLLVPLVLSYC